MDSASIPGVTEFFRINQMLVYAAYGAVFLLMGIATGVQSMKHSRLALGNNLAYLAAFGILHGLAEWGDVFIPIQATYMDPRWVVVLELGRLGLHLSSFLFLLRFALNLLLRPEQGRLALFLPLLVGAAVVLLTAGGRLVVPAMSIKHQLITGEMWSRILAGFPGAMGAGVALYREARYVDAQGLPRISGWLRAAAWAFGGYATLTGLITPAHQYLVRYRLDPAAPDMILGVPVPVLRAVMASVVAFNVIRSLHAFQVETDRMLEEAKQEKLLVAERELTALSDIAVSLGGSREPGTVPSEVLDRLIDLLKLGEARAVLSDLSGQVIATSRSSAPVQNEAALHGLIRTTLQQGGLVSAPLAEGGWGIGIPVTAKQQVIGVLALMAPSSVDLSDQERQCLISIGNLVGIAKENGRLWREIQRKEALRSELLGRVIQAQEEERKRVARELHDEIGQTLSALVIRMGAAIEAQPPEAVRTRWILEGNRELLSDSIHELRNLILRLRPAALDDLGLVPVLRRLGKQLGQDFCFHFSLRSAELPGRLPRAIETELFRIGQEALTNVAKHSGASKVSMSLKVEDDELVCVVLDNGRGFNSGTALAAPDGRSYGLMGMQERATLVGGRLLIASEPGRGTRVEVRIPLMGGGVGGGEPDSNSARG